MPYKPAGPDTPEVACRGTLIFGYIYRHRFLPSALHQPWQAESGDIGTSDNKPVISHEVSR
ncbi:hypothetical protein [Nibrella viscosa]|uniref:hypothetical protein n=1 Tax=Nibrella viscosa TaxID=1084524 RepID=UPI0031E6A290